MPRRFSLPFPILILLGAALPLASSPAQTTAAPQSSDSVRVSVTVNEDGSRTGWKFDPPNHKAVATTTERDGKLRTKIEYVLDDAGRFANGRVFGPDGKFVFRAVYKYDSAGHLIEESRFTKDNQPGGKIVYDFDAAGQQTGYAIYDKDGHLIGRTSPGTPTASPSSGRGHGR